jgi:hypothetical protein
MGLLSVLPRSGVAAKPPRRRPNPGADFLGWAQRWSSFLVFMSGSGAKGPSGVWGRAPRCGCSKQWRLGLTAARRGWRGAPPCGRV